MRVSSLVTEAALANPLVSFMIFPMQQLPPVVIKSMSTSFVGAGIFKMLPCGFLSALLYVAIQFSIFLHPKYVLPSIILAYQAIYCNHVPIGNKKEVRRTKNVSNLDQFSKIGELIDKNLPERQQRVQLCKILLEELANLTPNDLADYLTFYGIDFIVPGVVVRLKFPIRAHIFNPDCAEVKGNI